jgi:hypothetical protein
MEEMSQEHFREQWRPLERHIDPLGVGIRVLMLVWLCDA